MLGGSNALLRGGRPIYSSYVDFPPHEWLAYDPDFDVFVADDPNDPTNQFVLIGSGVRAFPEWAAALGLSSEDATYLVAHPVRESYRLPPVVVCE